jgi:hypothetical protein
VSLRLSHASCLAQIPSAPIRLDPEISIQNPSFSGSIPTIILVGGEQLRAATLNATQILDQDRELAVTNQGKFCLRSHDLSRSMLPYVTTMLQKLTKAKRFIPRQFNYWIKLYRFRCFSLWRMSEREFLWPKIRFVGMAGSTTPSRGIT